MANGWIKLHRKTLSNPIICKDADHLSIWVYLLLNATHKELPREFNGKKITLQPGQLITGRQVISRDLGVNESKTQRVLKKFETEHQIEQQTCGKGRLITVINWESYQQSEQQEEQPVNNERTTSEQPVNTNKNERTKEDLLCADKPAPDTEKAENQMQDFEKIYAAYPKKRGKAKAFEYYRGFVSKNGRMINGKRYKLTNRQIYIAVSNYVAEKERDGADIEYYKDFSSLLNKPILDYLEDEG